MSAFFPMLLSGTDLLFAVGGIATLPLSIELHEKAHQIMDEKYGIQSRVLKLKPTKRKLLNFGLKLPQHCTETLPEEEIRLSDRQIINKLAAGPIANFALTGIGLLAGAGAFVAGTLLNMPSLHSMAVLTFGVSATTNAILGTAQGLVRETFADFNRIRAIRKYAKIYKKNPTLENKRNLDIARFIGDFKSRFGKLDPYLAPEFAGDDMVRIRLDDTKFTLDGKPYIEDYIIISSTEASQVISYDNPLFEKTLLHFEEIKKGIKTPEIIQEKQPDKKPEKEPERLKVSERSFKDKFLSRLNRESLEIEGIDK